MEGRGGCAEWLLVLGWKDGAQCRDGPAEQERLNSQPWQLSPATAGPRHRHREGGRQGSSKCAREQSRRLCATSGPHAGRLLSPSLQFNYPWEFFLERGMINQAWHPIPKRGLGTEEWEEKRMEGNTGLVAGAAAHGENNRKWNMASVGMMVRMVALWFHQASLQCDVFYCNKGGRKLIQAPLQLDKQAPLVSPGLVHTPGS